MLHVMDWTISGISEHKEAIKARVPLEVLKASNKVVLWLTRVRQVAWCSEKGTKPSVEDPDQSDVEGSRVGVQKKSLRGESWSSPR